MTVKQATITLASMIMEDLAMFLDNNSSFITLQSSLKMNMDFSKMTKMTMM